MSRLKRLLVVSPKLCRFRKGLLQDWQKYLNKSGNIGTLLMDLTKAYDCLPHDLLIAELAACSFNSSILMHIFLTDTSG